MEIDHPILDLERFSAGTLSASLRPFVSFALTKGLFFPTNKSETKYNLRGKKRELTKNQIYSTLFKRGLKESFSRLLRIFSTFLSLIVILGANEKFFKI